MRADAVTSRAIKNGKTFYGAVVRCVAVMFETSGNMKLPRGPSLALSRLSPH